MNKGLLGISATCFAGVAFALYAQHMWDMQPCPWCIIQRMIYIALGLITLVTGLMPGKRGSFSSIYPSRAWKIGAWASLALAVLGVGIAAYQSLVAASQVSCNLTLAHKFISAVGLDELAPEIFKVRASCADAAHATLLGVPFEIASGVLFLILALWSIQIILRQRLRR
jgi:protein dithiol:quinone oxidoreductase